MRTGRRSALVVVAALFVAAPLPAAAPAAGMQYVSDAQGRFRIGFPAGWKVNRPPTDAPAVQGIDLRSSPPHLNVNVVIEHLPQPLSPEDYARLSRPIMAATFHEFTVLQEGPARIARRHAYYRYYTWRANTGSALYQVQAYFTVGREGFVLTGTTLNAPDRIKNDVPVIGRIFETFAPGAR